jgi:hypothetical protein
MDSPEETTGDIGLDSATVVTYAERPELDALAWEVTKDAFPEYNNHGDTLTHYWPRLASARPDFQFCLINRSGSILARCESLPLRWSGSLDDLPAGIDGAIVRGFENQDANTLCAMVICVPRGLHGASVSSAALRAMRDLAMAHGYANLLAPVRPSWKERYPLVPIEQYATWQRSDGLLFDPWLRTHERLGARVLRAEPKSLRITGTVAEWEDRTRMAFPESGTYWFPQGLSTVSIDVAANVGQYWEPNVWMLHET